MIDVSIVLSFYNEETIIQELLSRLRKVLNELILSKNIKSYELVFVNDCSTDKSEEILMAEINSGDIVLINMSRNFGVSECVLAGMEHSKGDVVIYMDADLQDPPELIPKLIEEWKNNIDVDVVYTTRTRRDGEHWIKLLLTKFGYRFINFISNIELPVDSGDFKLLSRRIVDILLTMKEDKPYIRGIISWIGFKQSQVFYERSERYDGRKNSKMPVLSKKVIYYWLDTALISFSDAPLKTVLFIGLAISVISILYIIIVVFQKILGLSVPGWAAIMSAILFLGGMQMMMLGFIGIYIGSIFRESKHRPRFIIKDIHRKI